MEPRGLPGAFVTVLAGGGLVPRAFRGAFFSCVGAGLAIPGDGTWGLTIGLTLGAVPVATGGAVARLTAAGITGFRWAPVGMPGFGPFGVAESCVICWTAARGINGWELALSLRGAGVRTGFTPGVAAA